jgi:hypothetical protein
MRVIRTEMYFDRPEFETAADVPGVVVAWIKGETREQALLGSTAFAPDGPRDDEAVFSTFEDIQLSGIASDFFEHKLRETIRYVLYGRASGVARVDSRFIDFVLDQPIVIEQSPPIWIKLKEVVDNFRKDPKAVGAFVGILAGYQYPPFLLITVPAGIFLVGSAPAITDAVQRGCVRLINNFFKERKDR